MITRFSARLAGAAALLGVSAWAVGSASAQDTFDVKALCDRQYAEGLEFKKNSRWSDAKDAFVGVVEACPDYLDAYLQLGNISISLREFDEAIEYYEKAKNLDAENLDVKEALAYAYTSSGALDDAEDLYLDVLEADATRLGAVQNLAYNYEQQGKTAESLMLYTHALEVDSTNAQVPERLARAYLSMKQVSQALNYHRMLVDMHPENLEFRIKLAHFHYKMENWPTVVELYEDLSARDEDPSKKEYYTQVLGKAYAELGDIEKTIEQYDVLVDGPNPPSWATFYNYIDLLLDYGRLSKAAQVVEKGIAAHPGEGCLTYIKAEIFEKRALAAQENQAWDEARRLFKQAQSVFSTVASGDCAGNAVKQVARQDQLLERLGKLQERNEQGE